MVVQVGDNGSLVSFLWVVWIKGGMSEAFWGSARRFEVGVEGLCEHAIHTGSVDPSLTTGGWIMSRISGAPPNPIHDGMLVSNIRETSAVPSGSGEMKRDTNHEAWRA